MAEVTRKPGESFESLIRRFTRRTIQSGRILQAKKIRFYRKPASDRKRRESALHREQVRSQREYLKRIGRLDELQEKRRRFY